MNLDLFALPRGTHLRIGNQAVIEVTRLRNPCVQINACQPRLLNVVLGRDDNGELVRKAAIMGVVVQGGPRTAGLGLAGIVQPKADLQTDLKLSNGAIRHLAADLRDLEPFQVSQRLACARYAVADGLLETLRRTTHYFGDAICVIGHGRPPDFAENTWIDNHTRARRRAQPPRDVIHGLDFTVPLGAGRRAPQQRLRIVLQAMTTPKTLKYFGVDLAGIELRADDFD